MIELELHLIWSELKLANLSDQLADMTCNFNILLWATVPLISWIGLTPALNNNESKLLCPPSPANCKYIEPKQQNTQTSEDYFTVSGVYVIFSKTMDKVLSISCFTTLLSIDDPSFPKFDPVLYIESIEIENCGPPKSSYVSAFHAFHITGLTNLTLSFMLVDQESAFAPHLFIGLNNVHTLKIQCEMFKLRHIDLDFLQNLKNLKHLELGSITVASFPSLNQLRSITIYGRVSLDELKPFGGCDHLKHLVIKKKKADIPILRARLPDKWLANCTRLASLVMQISIVNELPQEMVNSSFLRTLEVFDCQMKNLSSKVLVNARNLRILDLSYNRIAHLNSDTFSSVTSLERLILTNNRMQIQSLSSFAPLVFLKELVLNGNFIKDTCEISDNLKVTNPWPLLPSLENLSLTSTIATKLCPEWYQSMPKLKYLDLSDNLVEKLQYKDIKMVRDNGWEVNLLGNNLKMIMYDENDYKAHLRDFQLFNYTSSNNAKILVNPYPRACNCHWYWFARALKERPRGVSISVLECDSDYFPLHNKYGGYTNSVPISFMRLENFVCEVECDRGCKCNRRAHDGTIVGECNGANLTQVPHFSIPREIHVAHNYIETLDITDFPETLEYMDLRYNRLSMVDEKIASVMFGRSNISYRLEGNPIICACNNSEFINALNTHQNQVLDYADMACSNGQLIKYVTDSLCVKDKNMIAIGTVLGCVALVPFIVSILYYRYRNEILIILYAWGWCACCVNEEELDKDKTYDVFVSFAYDDSPYVMDEMLPGLEKEPHAFSVCIHYRDWMPGEWIPTQIAESVEQSRRTIIVLSKNFLSSIWSLLEFRTAHTQALKDKCVRLIIVLLDDVIHDERMDDELRAYLSTNTYIRRGDPRFWDKLHYALPHRRRNERRARAAGEAVMRRVRPDDPVAGLRPDTGLELMAIKPPHDTAQQEVSIS